MAHRRKHYILPAGLSGTLPRSANAFNSVGLLAISGYLVWWSIERLAARPGDRSRPRHRGPCRILILATGRPVFDPLIALGLAAAIAVTTVRALAKAGGELVWPPTVVCGHPGSDRPVPGPTAAAGTGSAA